MPWSKLAVSKAQVHFLFFFRNSPNIRKKRKRGETASAVSLRSHLPWNVRSDTSRSTLSRTRFVLYSCKSSSVCLLFEYVCVINYSKQHSKKKKKKKSSQIVRLPLRVSNTSALTKSCVGTTPLLTCTADLTLSSIENSKK